MADEAQAQVTDNLALKKKARRRLVGTVALVILSLLILPQVLKNKSHKVKPQEPIVLMPQETPDIAVSAPNTQLSQNADEALNESGFSTEAIADNLANEYDDAKPAAVNKKPVKTVSAEPKAAKETSLPVKAKEAVAKVKEASAEGKSSDNSKNADKAEQKAKSIEKKEAVKSKVVKAVQQPVSKEEKKTTKPAGNKPDVQGYAVQLGVFADPENVKKMQAKIALAGFESKTSTVSKGTRLRVGYFVSREGAEQALATLKQNGLSGKIVAR